MRQMIPRATRLTMSLTAVGLVHAVASGAVVASVYPTLGHSVSSGISASSPATRRSVPPVRGFIPGAGSGETINGQYLVKLKNESAGREETLARLAASLVDRHHGKLRRLLVSAQAFSVEMDQDDAEQLAADPAVEYVEQQRVYRPRLEQPNVPNWGLGRIDQRFAGGSGSYNYPVQAGRGVNVYVIDSGIRIKSDFENRVSWAFNARDGGNNADDCNGHGTFVAGVIGSKTYGVAKQARIWSVKVFGCDGTASDDVIINAFDWVRLHGVRPAVVNFSAGSTCVVPGTRTPAPCPPGAAQGVIDAERRAIAAGFPVVTAAGDENVDACWSPVTAYDETMNVGTLGIGDRKYNRANFGGCLDLWAPGEVISSLGGVGTDPATGQTYPDPRVENGSSGAAAFATGAVAVLLSTPQWASATPAQIAAEMYDRSTEGRMTGLDGASPNRILYSRPSLPGSSLTAACRCNPVVGLGDGTISVFGTTEAGDLYKRTQTVANINTPVFGPWEKSVTGKWQSVAAATDRNARRNLLSFGFDTRGWIRREGTAGDSWTNLRNITGGTSAAMENTGRLVVFATNQRGELFYRAQHEDDEGFGAFTSIDIGAVRAISVAVALDDELRIELFVTDKHGQVWQSRETGVDTLSWPRPVALPDVYRPMNEVAATSNADRRVVIFGTDGAGNVWRRSKAPGDTDWSRSRWTAMPAATVMHLAAVKQENRQIIVMGVDNHGLLVQTTQSARNGESYPAWQPVAGATVNLRS
jgi:hypothetical protein